MSGACFWTDLVNVTQTCEAATGNNVTLEAWGIASADSSQLVHTYSICGGIPDFSASGDGSYLSARYQIDDVTFNALSCGGTVDLATLTREEVVIGLATEYGILHMDAAWQNYSWPNNDGWYGCVWEITDTDGVTKYYGATQWQAF